MKKLRFIAKSKETKTVVILERGVKFVCNEPKRLEIIPIFCEEEKASEITIWCRKFKLGSQMARLSTKINVITDNVMYLGFEKT